jgi:formamidopyrimidine-DNA glycosylase
MFELPEFTTLSKQINATLTGKVIQQGSLGNSPHKFVWYNRQPAEFAALTQGKTLGESYTKGKWLFIPLEPAYRLVLGECGGRVLYHPAGAALPKKYHLWLSFTDGSAFTATTQMWGAMELYEAGQEQNRQYIQGMRPTPVEPQFTFDHFSALVAEVAGGEKRSVKGLLTQEGFVPGIGNALAQDILFRARLHPKHAVSELDRSQKQQLYQAIMETVAAAIQAGGRYDEVDLYDHPGGYHRLMDSQAVGQPCPACGHPIEKLQYLGGACYFCVVCQQ